MDTLRNVYMENSIESMLFILVYLHDQLERSARKTDDEVYFDLIEKFDKGKPFFVDNTYNLVTYRQRIDTLLEYFDDRIQEYFFENIDWESRIDWDKEENQYIPWKFPMDVGGVSMYADFTLRVINAEPDKVTYTLMHKY